jgi:hypothetical protein
VRTDALEYAVLMAQSRNAILVPLSLINERGGKGARLEDIQQSRDFLAAIAHKALKHGVEIEQKEVYTADPVTSIRECMRTMNCDGLLLLVEKGKGVLLQTVEIKHVMASVSSPVHVIRMQCEQDGMSESGFIARCTQMFNRRRVKQLVQA